MALKRCQKGLRTGELALGGQRPSGRVGGGTRPDVQEIDMHVKAFGLRRERWKATAIAVILRFSHHLTGVFDEINVEHGS